jgi:hypothetical protein
VLYTAQLGSSKCGIKHFLDFINYPSKKTQYLGHWFPSMTGWNETYSGSILTPWRTDLVEKLIVPQLVIKWFHVESLGIDGRMILK